MKKSVILLFFALLVFCDLSYAQIVMRQSGDDNTVHYNLERNSPNELPKLTVGINPLAFYLGYYGTLAFGGNLDINYAVSPSLSIFGNATISYLPGGGSYSTSPPQPIDRYHEANAGVLYYFLNITKQLPQPVIISSVSYGNYRTNTYVNVPVDKVKKLGLEGGFNNLDCYLGGTFFWGKIYAYPINDPSQKRYTLYNASYSSFTANSIFIGLNYTMLNDYLVSFRDNAYPKRNISNQTQIYLDVLIPFTGSYTNVNTKDDIIGGAPDGEYNLNKYMPKNNIGIRAGYKFTSKHLVGFTWGAEMGVAPGFSSSFSYYNAINVGIALSK